MVSLTSGTCCSVATDSQRYKKKKDRNKTGQLRRIRRRKTKLIAGMSSIQIYGVQLSAVWLVPEQSESIAA